MAEFFYHQIASFKQKLVAVKVDDVTNDLLVKKYLQNVLQQQDYYLKIYSWVLENIIKKSTQQIQQINFLDFGCGNGLFAIFAKYCGFGKVYGCDFNKNFVVAARVLANQMQIEIDDWFECNESDLYINCKDLRLDVVAGTDVIEHIYNLDIFFSNIYLLNTKMITAFTTASVYENYFKRRSLYKLMYQDEYLHSNALEATSLDEYMGQSYLNIRKQIISKEFPQLTHQNLLQLATATRGLRNDDILKFVNNFLNDGTIQQPMKNKYNTCDPISGNYTERMLTVKQYKSLYANNHFVLEVKSGFYNEAGSRFLCIAKKWLNKIILMLCNSYFSRTISPLILLLGMGENKYTK